MEWPAEVKRDMSFTFVQLGANEEALVGATVFRKSDHVYDRRSLTLTGSG